MIIRQQQLQQAGKRRSAAKRRCVSRRHAHCIHAFLAVLQIVAACRGAAAAGKGGKGGKGKGGKGAGLATNKLLKFLLPLVGKRILLLLLLAILRTGLSNRLARVQVGVAR